MGNQQNNDWNDFSFFFPFNHPEHYHSYCLITDFNNQEQVFVSLFIDTGTMGISF